MKLTDDTQVQIIQDGKPTSLTFKEFYTELHEDLYASILTKVKADIGAGPIKPDPPTVDPPPIVVNPPKPRPIYGAPRTKIGDWTDQKGVTYPIFEGAGIKTNLIGQKSSDPDEFFALGYNLDYKLLPGKSRPTGPESYYGVKPPKEFVPPLADYDEMKFPDGATYYRIKPGSASTTQTLDTVFSDTYVLNQ